MFVRNVLKIGSGNMLAQLLSLAVVPLLTRLYSPESYGAFAVYLALVSTLFPVATLRFHAALVLPERREDAHTLLGIALLSVVGSALVLGAIVAVVVQRGWVPWEWTVAGVTGLLWLAPLNVMVLGAGQVVSFWAVREKQFGASAVARVTESFVDRIASLSFGAVAQANAMGLVGGRMLGSAAAATYLFTASLRPALSAIWDTFHPSDMLRLARRYRHFALVSTWATLCDGASRQMPAVLMGVLFPPAVAGFYGLAVQVVNVPILIVGDAIASVFFQRAAESRAQSSKLAHDTFRLVDSMLCVVIPLTLVLTFLGAPLFRVIFGQDWEAAGAYAQILAIGFLFSFLHRPLCILFDVLELQTQRLWFDAGVLVSRVAAMVGAAAVTHSPESVLIALTVTSAVLYGCGLAYLFQAVGVEAKLLLGSLFGKALVFLPLTAALWVLAKQSFTSGQWLAVVIVAFTLQIILLYRFERSLFSTILGRLAPSRP